MISKIDQREQAVDKIAQHLLRTGLSQTSLRQLAAAAGVSDRMLLYYFDKKDDALASALGFLAMRMAVELETRIPAGADLSVKELFLQTAAMASSAELRPYMDLAIELSAAAMRKTAPYEEIAKAITAQYLAWMEMRLAEQDPVRRRGEAAMVLAMLDGLAILRAVGDEALEEIAVSAMKATL